MALLQSTPVETYIALASSTPAGRAPARQVRYSTVTFRVALYLLRSKRSDHGNRVDLTGLLRPRCGNSRPARATRCSRAAWSARVTDTAAGHECSRHQRHHDDQHHQSGLRAPVALTEAAVISCAHLGHTVTSALNGCSILNGSAVRVSPVTCETDILSAGFALAEIHAAAEGEDMANRTGAAAAPVSSRPTEVVGRSRWFIVFLLLVAVTTAFFDRINISVLFTDTSFLTTLGIKGNPAMMGLLMTAFVFAYGISAVLLSFSSDLIGPRKTLALITILLAVTMGWMGFVTAYGAMLIGRVVLGVAEGPQFGSANAVVKRWFPPKEQSFANSIWTIGSPLGSALGFPLVFYLVAHYGWRASFHLLAILNAVVVLPLIWFFLKDFPSVEVAAAYSSKANEGAISFRESLGMFIHDWRFWMLAIYDCGAMIYLWGFNSWLPAYLRVFRHLNIARAGIYSALPFVLMVIGEVAGAKLSDKLQRRAIFCFVGLIAAGVCILIASISAGATTAAWYLAWSAFFWGATVPTLFALGFQIIPAKVTAAGFGVYAGLANLVGATAPFVMGWIIGRAGNYNHGLAVLVLSCIVLAFPMVPLLRKY